MKRKSFIFLFLIVASSILFMHIVYGDDKPDALPVYVIEPPNAVNVDIDEEYGDRVTWSNYTKLFYIFTHMGKTAVYHSNLHYIVGYAFSPDGVNWNGDQDFFQSADHEISSEKGKFDFTLSPDGRYLWIAYIVDIIGGDGHDKVYIIKFELHLNGTITQLAPRQRIYDAPIQDTNYWVDSGVQIEVDSDGHPFVAVGYIVSSAYGTFVRWSNSDSATWSGVGQTFFDALMDYNKNDQWAEHSKLHRLADGKMAWTMAYRRSLGNDIWACELAVFDGTNWLQYSKEIFEDEYASGHIYQRLDVVTRGDEIIAVYDFDTFHHYLHYVNKTYNSEWSAPIELTIHDDTRRNPSLTVNPDGEVYLFLMINGGDSINYTRRFANGSWSGIWNELYINDSQVFNWDEFTCPDNFYTYAPIIYHDDSYSDMELVFDYLALEDDYMPIVLEYYNTTLYDEFGNSLNGEWVFEGDIYTFVSFVSGNSVFELNFTDGQHNIIFRFNNATNEMYIVSGERFVIGEIHTNYTLYSDGTQKILWRFIPDINIVDITNTTVDYYMYNSEFDLTVRGYTGVMFNIYNLGGLTSYEFVGDGGRTPYGTPFEVYATNGSESSSAYAEQIFRKLQHVSFLVEIDMDNEWESGNHFDIDGGVGYVDIGFDYRLNGSWVDGFKIKLYVYDADVGHHDAGNDHNWIEWSVDFYNYDPDSGTQQNLQTQYIMSNHWGYENEALDPDYHNRTSTQLWIDLWFDKTNASTTVAVQVNSYYYGMKEHGSAWWFGYGLFQPMISDYDNAKFLDDLYDEGGNVTNIQKFELIKFYVKVGKVDDEDGNDETWTIRAIEDMHREEAIDRMGGIDEPTFVQTKVLDMPQTGFINALKSAINGLSKLIWAGAFQFVKLLMGAVGSLMDAIGLGEWWIAFNTLLGQLATFSLNLMEQLQYALINSALLLTQIFNLVSAGLGRFIGAFTSSVSAILQWYQGIIDLFTGSGGIFNIDIWTSLGLGDWAILGIHLLPVWWIDRLAKAKSLGDTAKSDIQFIVWIVSGLFGFLVNIIMLAVNLLNMLLGMLPI